MKSSREATPVERATAPRHVHPSNVAENGPRFRGRRREDRTGGPGERPAYGGTAFGLLAPPLQAAVREAGYGAPTPIQEQAIPPILEGRDVLGCAQTGTGKTAAFMLPILHRLDRKRRRPAPGRPRVLVIAPTRELAAQIGESVGSYGRHLRVESTVIFGGVNQRPQVGRLRRGVDILVATPGRLLDLMQQGHLTLDGVEVFVLDEADRMLDMGFLPDIRRIVARLPERRHSLFFSATLGREVTALARTLVKEPVRIDIAPEQPAVEKINQRLLFVEKADKDRLLAAVLRDERMERVIVFTRTKHGANKVVRKLEQAGVRAAAIHGNKSQAARTRALGAFRQGRIRVLVATDIAARGLDVDRISHVVNYDLPNEPETYVHRIGRTARAGLGGVAISFCSAEERAWLRGIERLLKRRVPEDLSHGFHSERARNAPAGGPAPRRGRGGPRTWQR